MSSSAGSSRPIIVDLTREESSEPETLEEVSNHKSQPMIVDLTGEDPSESETMQEVSAYTSKTRSTAKTLHHDDPHQPKSLVVKLKLKKGCSFLSKDTSIDQAETTPPDAVISAARSRLRRHRNYHPYKSLVATFKFKKGYSPTSGFTPVNQAETTPTTSSPENLQRSYKANGSPKFKFGIANPVKKPRIRCSSENEVSSGTNNPLSLYISSPNDLITSPFDQTPPEPPVLRGQELLNSLSPSKGWQDILAHQNSLAREVSEPLRSRDPPAAPLLTPFTYTRSEPDMPSLHTNANIEGLNGSSEDTTSQTDPALQGPRSRPRRQTKPTFKASPSGAEAVRSRKRKSDDDDWIPATPKRKSAKLDLSTPPLSSASAPAVSPSLNLASVLASQPSIVSPTLNQASFPASESSIISPSVTQGLLSSTTISASNPSHSFLPDISLEKQNRTTLRASCVTAIVGIVLLKLRSCMTMDDFFSKIISATGYAEQGSSISTIMVTFDFKSNDDCKKTIFVKRDVADSFEGFLEIINEAPCWSEEGGRCEVAVDVVPA